MGISSIKMNKNTYRQRFTLIEMLIVVGIASLLFALLGPAFNRMTRGNAVDAHAAGLKLGIERARVLAISSRRYTALLLPSREKEDSSGYNYQRGGFRLAYVTEDGSGSYKFDQWIPDTDWTNRGKGAYLMEIAATSNGSPKRSAYENSTDIVLHETVFDSKINGEETLYNVSKIPEKVDICRALIFSPFGDIRVDSDEVELYFYITGEQKVNFLEIRLNKLTGKVEFVGE